MTKSKKTDKLSKFYNATIRAIGVNLHAKAKDDHMTVTALMFVLDRQGVIRGGSAGITVNGHYYESGNFKRRSFHFPVFIRLLKAHIPYADLEDANIHNKVLVKYVDPAGKGFVKPIAYNFLPRAYGDMKVKRPHIDDISGTSIYFRQSLKNGLYITSRRTVKSDYRHYRDLINRAFWLSWLLRWRNIILLYEKESEKYEESAAVLYERLIDLGYRNVYFVLDPDSPHNDFVPEKYRSHVLTKHSLKHYIYFFVAKTFIGTEAPTNAIDSRVANSHANHKLYRSKLKYVFLQHGVMYMVSLASLVRLSFHKGNLGGLMPVKTVVSSQTEADHFIELAGYDQADMAVTGLPKFDRSIKLNTADKITIMPTWRPWEYNQVRHDPKKTRYYQMLVDIIASVPAEQRDKIHLLPHPLFIRELKNSDLSDYIKDFKSYDEVLRQTDTLITDYSSVAYDAFYRGSNVIFWWKEKDYCMEQYGGYLMLNGNNVFGDVAMNRRELKTVIKANHGNKQNPKYLRRYRKLVEFHDNKNTDRLIKLLQEERII